MKQINDSRLGSGQYKVLQIEQLDVLSSPNYISHCISASPLLWAEIF